MFKASSTTPTAAGHLFGIDNMKTRAACVESCVREAQELYKAVDDLAHTQDRALLDSLGISSCSSDSGDESECTKEYDLRSPLLKVTSTGLNLWRWE